MNSFPSLSRLASASLLAISLLRAQDPISFSLSISANGGGGSTLYRDEPLLVQTLLLLETGQAAVVALKDGQKWDSALSVTWSDSKGAVLAQPWVRLGATLDPLAFNEEATEASALFGLPAEAINSLAPGNYVLNVTFQHDTSAADGSWKGRLSARATFSVSDGPRPESPRSKSLTSRLRARWLELNNRSDEALAELNTALEGDPDDIEILIDKADLLAGLERTQEAVSTLTHAIEVFQAKYPDARHPPRELLRRLRELAPL